MAKTNTLIIIGVIIIILIIAGVLLMMYMRYQGTYGISVGVVINKVKISVADAKTVLQGTVADSKVKTDAETALKIAVAAPSASSSSLYIMSLLDTTGKIVIAEALYLAISNTPVATSSVADAIKSTTKLVLSQVLYNVASFSFPISMYREALSWMAVISAPPAVKITKDLFAF